MMSVHEIYERGCIFTMSGTQATNSTDTITYQDCITGKIGAPTGKKKRSLFQLMMIASTVPTTVTVNWLITTHEFSWTAFSHYLYMYPLIIGIAVAVRFLIANPVVDRIVKAFFPTSLGACKKALSITLLNVLIMGTIVAFVRSLVSAGGLEYLSWEHYAASLPLSFAISFVFGYFVTSPLTKKVFARSIEPRIKVREAAHAEETTVKRTAIGKLKDFYRIAKKVVADTFDSLETRSIELLSNKAASEARNPERPSSTRTTGKIVTLNSKNRAKAA